MRTTQLIATHLVLRKFMIWVQVVVGCDTVGWTVTSNTKDTQFESPTFLFCKEKENSLRTIFNVALDTYSVTRFGDFLHFGQPFKAFGNNNFAQIFYILRQFL